MNRLGEVVTGDSLPDALEFDRFLSSCSSAGTAWSNIWRVWNQCVPWMWF